MSNQYKEAIEASLNKIKKNIDRYGAQFPHTSDQEVYELNDNDNWTSGFWVGMLWQAYQYDKDEQFLSAAREKTSQMQERLSNNANLDTHDIGFLYTPSTGAKWQIEKDETAKEMTIKAADRLMERYRETIGVFQAWGSPNDPEQGGRIIIDCMMNMPLLFWASEVTGEIKYKVAATNFVDMARRYLVRGDDSTYHTFYFDQKSGQPIRGATQQGYSDGSTWTRGQAWAVYGFALAYRYTKDKNYLETALRTANYFINHLPEKVIVDWDFDAPQDKDIKPDSSASAILVCGLHELLQLIEQESEEYKKIKTVLEQTMDHLINEYTTDFESQGLLDHGSYSVREGKSPDDYVIWGDYFYLEALLRLEKGFHGFWYEVV